MCLKESAGKVKPFQERSLAQVVHMVCDIPLQKLDVQEFGYGLRDFGNRVHSYEQISSIPTLHVHTIEVCFYVLKAALTGIARER